MQTITENGLMLALFSLGGGEIIIILAIVLILFGAKKLPELARGAGQGLSSLREAVNDEASEAGRSAGGIYGKPAAQALTPDNQVAELYDHAAFREEQESRQSKHSLWRLLNSLGRRILRFLALGHGTNQSGTPGK